MGRYSSLIKDLRRTWVPNHLSVTLRIGSGDIRGLNSGGDLVDRMFRAPLVVTRTAASNLPLNFI